MKMVVKLSQIKIVVTLFLLALGLGQARNPPIIPTEPFPPPPPNPTVKTSVNQYPGVFPIPPTPPGSGGGQTPCFPWYKHCPPAQAPYGSQSP
ncbi:hypothetical protein CARUB_v10019562mg [Capsella rubella]|uniref:Uncharacterized protein n=1 Tax=Capsella rubella TaxID=81985 RepID=R0HE94_9BRAS|nr:hypothetical protein CARUB_v10019562mg [Capsella rubella]